MSDVNAVFISCEDTKILKGKVVGDAHSCLGSGRKIQAEPNLRHRQAPRTN